MHVQKSIERSFFKNTTLSIGIGVGAAGLCVLVGRLARARFQVDPWPFAVGPLTAAACLIGLSLSKNASKRTPPSSQKTSTAELTLTTSFASEKTPSPSSSSSTGLSSSQRLSSIALQTLRSSSSTAKEPGSQSLPATKHDKVDEARRQQGPDQPVKVDENLLKCLRATSPGGLTAYFLLEDNQARALDLIPHLELDGRVAAAEGLLTWASQHTHEERSIQLRMLIGGLLAADAPFLAALRTRCDSSQNEELTHTAQWMLKSAHVTDEALDEIAALLTSDEYGCIIKAKQIADNPSVSEERASRFYQRVLAHLSIDNLRYEYLAPLPSQLVRSFADHIAHLLENRFTTLSELDLRPDSLERIQQVHPELIATYIPPLSTIVDKIVRGWDWNGSWSWLLHHSACAERLGLQAQPPGFLQDADALQLWLCRCSMLLGRYGYCPTSDLERKMQATPATAEEMWAFPCLALALKERTLARPWELPPLEGRYGYRLMSHALQKIDAPFADTALQRRITERDAPPPLLEGFDEFDEELRPSIFYVRVLIDYLRSSKAETLRSEHRLGGDVERLLVELLQELAETMDEEELAALVVKAVHPFLPVFPGLGRMLRAANLLEPFTDRALRRYDHETLLRSVDNDLCLCQSVCRAFNPAQVLRLIFELPDYAPSGAAQRALLDRLRDTLQHPFGTTCIGVPFEENPASPFEMLPFEVVWNILEQGNFSVTELSALSQASKRTRLAIVGSRAQTNALRDLIRAESALNPGREIMIHIFALEKVPQIGDSREEVANLLKAPEGGLQLVGICREEARAVAAKQKSDETMIATTLTHLLDPETELADTAVLRNIGLYSLLPGSLESVQIALLTINQDKDHTKAEIATVRERLNALIEGAKVWGADEEEINETINFLPDDADVSSASGDEGLYG